MQCVRRARRALHGDTVMQAAQDYKVDPYLRQACEADVNTRCKGVKPEKGQVQACLVCSICLSCARQPAHVFCKLVNAAD